MSQYLLSLYRPATDDLLERHDLTVPEETRVMLAKTIMHSRELPQDSKPRSHSPTPARKKVETHARALLEYSRKPPARKDSIGKRCVSLQKALLSSDLLALEIGIASHGGSTDFDLMALIDSLNTKDPEPAAVARLLVVLSRIPGGDWGKVGRPSEHSRMVVRSGCLAWKRAGRTDMYSWREDKGNPYDPTAMGVLEGALPAFLRGLLACCNGKDVLIARLDQARRPMRSLGQEEWRAKGDQSEMRDKHLQLAIADCKKAGLL